MSLALHAHHILIIATLAFAAGALIPFWYTSPNYTIKRNVFQICDINNNNCTWSLLPTSNILSVKTGKKFKDMISKKLKNVLL